MKQKIFIIDTNVVLFDPRAIFKFENHDVIVPIIVLEEVDRFKREMNETGRNARAFSRLLDELRTKGMLVEGISLPKGGTLKVDLQTDLELPFLSKFSSSDNSMIALAKAMSERHKNKEVIFVSKDVNLRIKADVFGIVAQDYRLPNFSHSVDREELYSGHAEVNVTEKIIEKFFTDKKVSIKFPFNPNQFVVMRNQANSSHTAIGRYDKVQDKVLPVYKPVDGLWGIYPKNLEQTFAVDLLLNEDIRVVSLVGKSGTGKTLLALAAGLSKTIDDGIYNRLLVGRPVMPMGKDIGFLPGTVEEKLHPYMQPVFDNVDFLFGSSSAAKSQRRGGVGRGCRELMEQGLLSIEPLTYIRGRSIPQQFIIVDEAQNLSPHEIKTIITRAGEGTKIVLTGDLFQIDAPYLDSSSSGLAYVLECFKGEEIAGHISLVKGERSLLSELASNLM